MPERDGPAPARNGKTAQRRQVFPTAAAAAASLESRRGPRSASWVYHNAEGDPVGMAVRWDGLDTKVQGHSASVPTCGRLVIDVEFWTTLVIEFWTTPAAE
jgi:hypothetical protein